MASDLRERSFNLFISSWRILDGYMFIIIYHLAQGDNVLCEFLHLLFGRLRDTDSYSPLHGQESVRCFFEALCKLVLVASDRLK